MMVVYSATSSFFRQRNVAHKDFLVQLLLPAER
jgi:hypothetical protein